MRVSMKYKLVLMLATVAVFAPPADAQAATPSGNQPRADLSVAYSYLHTNAPPSGCGCFSPNGGSVSLAWPVRAGRFALAGDSYAGHSSAIANTGYDLNLSAYTVDVHYLPRVSRGEGRASWRPFGQVLVGVAHADGSLVQSPNPAASNAGAAFAANIGGGLDKTLNGRFSIRLVQADYLLTTFANGVNDHQNNLRLSAGLVFHF